MAEVLNPVLVEEAIRDAVAEVAKGVTEFSRTFEAFRTAERAFDLAWAQEYMRVTGPVEERKQACVIRTAEQKAALDVAEVAFKYVDKRLRAAEAKLSAYQTLSKSVMAMYGAAGRGGGYGD